MSVFPALRMICIVVTGKGLFLLESFRHVPFRIQYYDLVGLVIDFVSFELGFLNIVFAFESSGMLRLRKGLLRLAYLLLFVALRVYFLFWLFLCGDSLAYPEDCFLLIVRSLVLILFCLMLCLSLNFCLRELYFGLLTLRFRFLLLYKKI